MGKNAFDGYFEILTEPDGVYVDLYEAQPSGTNVELYEIEQELEKLGLSEYSLTLLGTQMVEGFDHLKIKVADMAMAKVSSGEESFKIDISEDKMTANCTFYLSDEAYDKEAIIRRLKGRGVKFGIDEALLDALSHEREYNTPYIVANGKPAIDGEVAVITYMFKREKDVRPEMDAEGNVNYHKLNVIANVKKGQLLAKLKPATQGEEGMDLYGNIIAPRKPKIVKLRYGKNIETNEDKTQLFAACDGLVKLIDEKVVVNDAYDVPNNVGNSTGDIEFDGTVIVHGNVITGFTVKAKGDVEVLGVVEGATIISGGNIILHKGIQGMGKSHIESAGFVQARYIENANVIAGTDIHSEAILHSTVTCKGSVTVEGKKGMISGGTVRAGEYVKTKVLGSHMGTVTNVEVGIDPIMLSEYGDLRKDIPKMESELSKLEQVITLLNKRKELSGQLEDDKQEMYMSAVRNKIFLSNKLTQSKRKYEELEVQVENKNNGYVDVTNEIYPGVKITIGSVSTYVRDELRYVKIEKKGADVKMSSL